MQSTPSHTSFVLRAVQRNGRYETTEGGGARTAYFIPGRDVPGLGPQQSVLCLSVCLCPFAGGSRGGRGRPTRETLRFCLLGWVAAGPRNDPPL